MRLPIKLEDLVEDIKKTLNKDSLRVINLIHENEKSPSLKILKKRLDKEGITYSYTKNSIYPILTETETQPKQIYEIDLNQINLIN